MSKTLILLLTLLLTLPALAQERRGRPDFISVGAGISIRENHRPENQAHDLFGRKQDKDILIMPIPFFMFKYKRVSLRGPRLSLKLFRLWFTSWNAFVDHSGDKFKHPEIAERDSSTFAGISARIIFLQLSFKKDVGNKSGGSVSSIGYSHRIQLTSKLNLRLAITGLFFDSKYSNYYYGVTEAEATAKLPAYTPGSSSETRLTLNTSYKLTDKLVSAVILSERILSKKIDRSPTVTERTIESMMLTMSYTF